MTHHLDLLDENVGEAVGEVPAAGLPVVVVEEEEVVVVVVVDS